MLFFYLAPLTFHLELICKFLFYKKGFLYTCPRGYVFVFVCVKIFSLPVLFLRPSLEKKKSFYSPQDQEERDKQLWAREVETIWKRS